MSIWDRPRSRSGRRDAPRPALPITLAAACALLAFSACAQIPPAPAHAVERLPGKARLIVEYHMPQNSQWQEAIADANERKTLFAAEGDLGKQRMTKWMSSLGLFEEIGEGTTQPQELRIRIVVSSGTTETNWTRVSGTTTYKVGITGILVCTTAKTLLVAQYNASSGEHWENSVSGALRATMVDVESKLLKSLAEDRDGQARMRAVFEGRFVDPPLASGLQKLDKNDLDGAIRDFSAALQNDPQSATAWGGRSLCRAMKRDFKGAMEDASKAVALDPSSPYGYRARGIVDLDQGNYEAAIADYTKLTELAPQLPQGWFNRGRALAAGKKAWDDAIRDFTNAVEQKPEQPLLISILFERALAHSGKGDREGAIADYTAILALDPRHVPSYGNRANEKRTKGDLDGALEDDSKTVELAPGNASAWLGRARTWAGKGDLDRALKDQDKAVELAPSWAEPYRARSPVRRQKGNAAGAEADLAMVAVLEGNQKFSQGDVDGAMSLYTSVLQSHPDHALAYSRRGAARNAKKDFAGAIEDLTKAIDLDPGIVRAYIDRAAARSAKGDRTGAAEDYDRAIEEGRQNPMAYYERGLFRRASGNLEGAVADFRKVLELSPKDANAYWNRGLAEFDRKNWTLAIADFAKVMELSPTFAGAYTMRGNARWNAGDVAGAGQDFAKAAEFAPTLAENVNNLGRVKFQNRNYDGAIADFSRALELDPRYAHAPYNRGLAKLNKGDRAGALLDFNRALEIDPKYLDAVRQRLALRTDSRDWAGIVQDTTKILELQPEETALYLKRGQAHLEMNDTDGAEKDLGTYIELRPEQTLDEFFSLSAEESTGAGGAKTKGQPRPAADSIRIARWRTSGFLLIKNRLLPRILRDWKTADLTRLVEKGEKLALDLNYQSERAKDAAQKAVETNSGDPQFQRDLSLVYRERIEVLKPILAALKEEVANRGK